MNVVNVLGGLLLFSGLVVAQPRKTPLERPKLVVGIVVDQMRYDYLYRFYDKYSDGGFRRLMREGFNARNNHYHYAATYTGPGHAHIYNGSAPALSGIVGNDWFDRKANRLVYCTEDSTVQTVGNAGSAGKMSPRNMRVSNLCDQLKIATQGRSKVVGIALKDRGAILPAGHAANAAYWFDSKDGNWISSTFYMPELPQWVKDLNARKLPDQYNARPWTPLLPLSQYTESTADDAPFEGMLQGETKGVFPHTFAAAMGLKYEELRTSPYGDQLTKEMALAALKGENLGKNGQTDVLCVSFSSPDYIGHRFGSESVEVQDEYLRLDRVVAELLNAFDAQVGKGNYLVFLSADHGAAHTPGYLQSLRVPAGTREAGEVTEAVRRAMEGAFGPGEWLKRYFNQQIYLNTDLLVQKKVPLEAAFEAVRAELLKSEGIVNVFNLHNVAAQAMPENLRYQFNNLYDPKRCGDFYVLFNPNHIEGYRKGGTTHGTSYNYDTHVPFLLYGWGVKPGETTRRTYIHDIAPTVTALLHLIEPNGTVGDPVLEALR